MRKISHLNDRTHILEHLDVKAGGVPKAHGPTAIHSGMTEQQKFAGLGGLHHATIASAVVANPASPILTKAPISKVLQPVATSFGMKNRSCPGMSDKEAQDLGKLILAGAKR